ncbi:MAG: hypothetical protein R8K53_00515 [Mariprofundaceae bacterium]
MSRRNQYAGLSFLVLFLLMAMLPLAVHAATDAAAEKGQFSSGAVMQQFASDVEIAAERRIETERKHQILFIMGISLLILILMTGGLGVAMVVFDKNVFVLHMICAWFSMTLAAAHAATAIAWFWPY